MYICAYACACVCTYLPNGRAYRVGIDKLFLLLLYLTLVAQLRVRYFFAHSFFLRCALRAGLDNYFKISVSLIQLQD